jgi:hypothetical protein
MVEIETTVLKYETKFLVCIYKARRDAFYLRICYRKMGHSGPRTSMCHIKYKSRRMENIA